MRLNDSIFQLSGIATVTPCPLENNNYEVYITYNDGKSIMVRFENTKDFKAAIDLIGRKLKV